MCDFGLISEKSLNTDNLTKEYTCFGKIITNLTD